VTFDVAGNLLHVHQTSAAVGLDFSRSQRARTDKAHVAAEDVPQLRQFVHRRGPQDAADASDARIVLHGGLRSDSLFGVVDHGNRDPVFD